MRATLLVVAVLACGSSAARAQGYIESSDGQFGAFGREGGAQFSVNFADKSMRVTVMRRVSTSRLAWGGELKAKSSDGVLKLFEDSLATIQWTGEAHFAYVLHDPLNDPTVVTLSGSIGYQYGRNALVDTGAAIVRRQQSLSGASARLGLNAFGGIGRTSFQLGLAGTYGPRSNIEDLDEFSVCQTTASAGGKTLQSCAPARLAADYKTSNEAALLMDFVVWPGRSLPIALIAYTRYNTPRAVDRFVPALGVMFGKTGAPLSIVGSVAVEFARSARINMRVGVPLGF